MGNEKRGENNDLMQILMNVIVIGVFALIQDLLFYFLSDGWGLFLIFGVLKLLVYCVLVINVYNSVLGKKKKEKPQNEMQVQALLYKQMKKLEDELPGRISGNMENALEEQKERLNERLDEVKLNQLRSVKAIMTKVEGAAVEEDRTNVLDINGKLQEFDTRFEKMEQMQEELKRLLQNFIADSGSEPSNALVEASIDEEKAVVDVDAPALQEEVVESSIPVDDNPGRELTPDEIAALFANVN